MTQETESQSPKLELETADGRPIAYIGPHPSFFPSIICIISPLLNIVGAADRDAGFAATKRAFELILKNNAKYVTQKRHEEYLEELARRRGLTLTRFKEIFQAILDNSDDLSRYIDYRQATAAESLLLSAYSPFWSVSSLEVTGRVEIPVLDESEFRGSN